VTHLVPALREDVDDADGPDPHALDALADRGSEAAEFGDRACGDRPQRACQPCDVDRRLVDARPDPPVRAGRARAIAVIPRPEPMPLPPS
jgi:hypothetical protein